MKHRRAFSFVHYYLRQEGYVFFGVCLFVWLDYAKTTRRIFTKFRRKGGTRATEETIRFRCIFGRASTAIRKVQTHKPRDAVVFTFIVTLTVERARAARREMMAVLGHDNRTTYVPLSYTAATLPMRYRCGPWRRSGSGRFRLTRHARPSPWGRPCRALCTAPTFMAVFRAGGCNLGRDSYSFYVSRGTRPSPLPLYIGYGMGAAWLTGNILRQQRPCQFYNLFALRIIVFYISRLYYFAPPLG